MVKISILVKSTTVVQAIIIFIILTDAMKIILPLLLIGQTRILLLEQAMTTVGEIKHGEFQRM